MPEVVTRPFAVVCEDGAVFRRYSSRHEAELVAVKLDVGGQMFPFHAADCPGLHTVEELLDA